MILEATLLVLAGLLAQDPESAKELPLSAQGEQRSIPAPGSGAVHALAVQGEHLWLARGSELFRISIETGEVVGSSPLPAFTSDLTADERFLYAIDSRGVLRILDPEAGKTVREVEVLRTEGGRRATGVVWRKDELVVLDSAGALHAVDPDGGDVLRTVSHVGAGNGPRRLAFDGEQLVICEDRGLYLVGEDLVDRVVPLLVPALAVAHSGAEFVLMVKRPGEDDDRIYFLKPTGEVRVFPLIVSTGAGEDLEWQLGARKASSVAELLEELLVIYDDRSTWYRDHEGNLRPPDVRIFHPAGATYQNIAVSVDAVSRAGFTEIAFHPLPPRGR